MSRETLMTRLQDRLREVKEREASEAAEINALLKSFDAALMELHRQCPPKGLLGARAWVALFKAWLPIVQLLDPTQADSPPDPASPAAASQKE